MSRITERGFLWIVLGLSLATAANVGFLAVVWIFQIGGDIDRGTVNLVSYLGDAFAYGSVLIGLMGYWRIWQGRHEFGAGHHSNVRRASWAILCGGASALTAAVTGLVLGFLFVPSEMFAGQVLRALHEFAVAFVAVFAGLFLLWTIWSLARDPVRGMAIGAALLGMVPSTLELLAARSVPLPAGIASASSALPLFSIGLWLAAYLLTMGRHGMLPSKRATGAAPNIARSESSAAVRSGERRVA